MRRTWLTAAVIVSAVGFAFADMRTKEKQLEKIYAIFYSSHDGQHMSGAVTGEENHAGHLKKGGFPASEIVRSASAATKWKFIYKSQAVIIQDAKFSPNLTGQTDPWKENGVVIGYDDTWSANHPWVHVDIDKWAAKISATYGTESLFSETADPAHIEVIRAEPVSMITFAEGVPSGLYVTKRNNGAPHRYLSSDGDWAVEYDENGQIVWDEEPAPVAQFNCYLTRNSTQVTITYSVENLRNESLSFSLPQVRSDAYPSGWTDVEVSGNAAVATTVVVSAVAWESIRRQSAQWECTFADGVSSGTQGVQVYTPTSKLEFDGTCSIVSAQHVQNVGNRVFFQIAGSPAAGAELLRVDSSGVWRAVDTVMTELATGVAYSLTDGDPEAGINRYMVHVGRGVNGVCSDDTSVSN